MNDFPLGIPGFQFSDLYQPKKLAALHQEFWRQTEANHPGLRGKFESLMTGPRNADQGAALIQVAEVVGDFIARIFNVATHAQRFRLDVESQQPIFRFRKEFLNTRVFKRLGEDSIPESAYQQLDTAVRTLVERESGSGIADWELAVAKTSNFFLDCSKKLQKEPLSAVENQRAQYLCSHLSGMSLPEKIQAILSQLEEWLVQVTKNPRRAKAISGWVSYRRPHTLDYENLVLTNPLHSPTLGADLRVSPAGTMRFRDGFKLTDPRADFKTTLREIDYCIYCHKRQKDSCSHGFKEQDGYRRNPLGVELKGCPLEERISEMHLLKKTGHAIGALAAIMLDNPMCPGTGHRICNDCMKSCIFQKQEPVNIPLNETAILDDVLKFPFGPEIYSLLTRFNPLNTARPFALPYNGKNILVVGMGPAGYTLAHHLANEGFGVVGIDALKIEPLDIGDRPRNTLRPIRTFKEISTELDSRVPTGFGGVSEYGITVRWDKNFLSLIYLSLQRRQNVAIYGGVRFGGTLDVSDAWGLGFDHVALASGAGRPNLLEADNVLAKGSRQASDFLMSLQLGGAFRKGSLSNLQIRLPAVVIGGGLTAIDTATETLAYYPCLVESVLARYEELSREMNEETIFRVCTLEEQDILREYLTHARAIRAERKAAQDEKRNPNLVGLLREWGGVNIVYRKRLRDSPAYRLNHEEVSHALAEGIGFLENTTPVAAVLDQYRALWKLRARTQVTAPDGTTETREIEIPARHMAMALGTQPNTGYEKEHPGTFKLDAKGRYFATHRAVKDESGAWSLEASGPSEAGAFFSSLNQEGRFVSFYGDNHPAYAGNVVKAMASAKNGAPFVSALFGGARESSLDSWNQLVGTLNDQWSTVVERVTRLTPTIVEVVVHAKAAATKFRPGQFYRFQTHEVSAHSVDRTRLSTEPIALTGAWVDRHRGLLSMIVLELGGSSRLCSLLKRGDKVSVMGPTGAPSEIPSDQTVVLVGGGLGNAVLFSIAAALKQNGCRVLYFAGYRRNTDLFYRELLEEATDQMVWATDLEPAIIPSRPQDRSIVGNIIEAMAAYGTGLAPQDGIRLSEASHLLVIGSDRMMGAVQKARHGVLSEYFSPHLMALGSINSPMQCMMKEICAQCLQRHVDPVTGKESYVFSCANQDQKLDEVDFEHLAARLASNSLLEKLSDLYLKSLLQKAKVERV